MKFMTSPIVLVVLKTLTIFVPSASWMRSLVVGLLSSVTGIAAGADELLAGALLAGWLVGVAPEGTDDVGAPSLLQRVTGEEL